LLAPAKLALIAALERELHPLIKRWTRIPRTHDNRPYIFFERDSTVCLCAGIGAQSARRATEALITLYHPKQIHSVGFAGALTPSQKVGDILTPALVLDARDNSRYQIPGGQGTLITFMEVANTAQKKKLATAYAAQAVDMEAAAVAAAAHLHNIPFAATKVISDEYNFQLPDTSRFITPHGQFNTAGFALYSALRPWLWPQVARLAANSSKAANALSRHLQQTLIDPITPNMSNETTLTRGRN
jgi:nucleoside phosphorylase